METFSDTLNSKYDSFLKLYQDIEEFSINLTNVSRKISYLYKSVNKIVFFFHTNVIKFPKNALIAVNDSIFSNGFPENVRDIIFGREVIHHSSITAKIIGYAHSFCNQKVRENKNQISVIAHNLFGFEFSFI